MKIAILGDTHFGARNDSAAFNDFFEKFYVETFIPYLRDNGVKTVIQLGDLFDRRKYINFNSLFRCKHYFFDQLKSHNVQLFTLVGNHDIFWRDSLEVNSHDLLLKEYDNVHSVSSPKTISFDDTTIDFIPWMCKENEEEVVEFISSSKSDLCVGHFEISGFAMYRGVTSEDGLKINLFERYERVISGHYHTRSSRENVIYVGTPYEMTWEDHGDPKGFHIFDTDTRELTFYENPFRMFTKIDYDDSANYSEEQIDSLTKKYVKVIVGEKNDHVRFDRFISSIYLVNPYEVKIIEDVSSLTTSEIESSVKLEDTTQVMMNYLDNVESTVNKDRLKLFMKKLYVEAVNMEVL